LQRVVSITSLDVSGQPSTAETLAQRHPAIDR